MPDSNGGFLIKGSYPLKEYQFQGVWPVETLEIDQASLGRRPFAAEHAHGHPNSRWARDSAESPFVDFVLQWNSLPGSHQVKSRTDCSLWAVARV